MQYEFREGAGLLTFRDKNKKTLFHGINKSIFHNFRQTIPENVDDEFTKYNFYYVNNHQGKIDKDNGYEKAKDYRQSVMNLARKNHIDLFENTNDQISSCISAIKRIKYLLTENNNY